MKGLKVFLLILLLSTMMARAEFFIDAYGGIANTQSGSFIAMREDNGSFSFDGGDLSGSTGSAVGLRGGYWFKKMNWLGGALDFSHFNAESSQSRANISFNSVSLMLMLRYPFLISDDFPNGRFYPYAGVGASLVFAEIDSPYVDAPGSERLDDDSGSGVVFCTGVTWFFNRNLGVFLEYRAVSLSFEQSAEWQTGAFFWPRYDHSYRAEGDATAHQFLGGVTVHF